MPKRACAVFEYKWNEVKKWWKSYMKWLNFLFCIASWWFCEVTYKVKWRDLNFVLYAMSAMAAMQCISALHGCLLKDSMVAPCFATFIALTTFSIFGWVRISIVEAGAITLILFSSWAGWHTILHFTQPLSSHCLPHIVAGPRVRCGW